MSWIEQVGWSPVCCNAVMVANDLCSFYTCRSCGREMSHHAWVNSNYDPLAIKSPKSPWRPTVPHPLIQLDESLREQGK